MVWQCQHHRYPRRLYGLSLLAMLKTRISIPATAPAGAAIEIKTLISHPMESGFRRDARGEAIARNILTRFECHYNDRLVFGCDLQPGMAANPFIRFSARIDVSGTFRFRWVDQHGAETIETRDLSVTP